MVSHWRRVLYSDHLLIYDIQSFYSLQILTPNQQMSKAEDQDKDQDLEEVPATSVDLLSSSSRSDAAGNNTNNNNINTTVTPGGGLREEDVLLHSPAEALQKRPMGPLEVRLVVQSISMILNYNILYARIMQLIM